MNPRVVLTMIVKNEGHVIERALNSCYQMIDSYCIVDTGSTDKTKEIIKNFFDSKGIEGKIVDFEFTNFEESRNQSILHAKDLGEYGFWMDADEELILDNTFNKDIFKHFLSKEKNDQLLIECIYGGMNYQRGQFYKFSADWYWYGPVHEVLQSKKSNITVGIFPFGHTKITPDGNSWHTDDLSKKYEDHANILLKYQEDNDWKDPRWTFYLAQSYRDAANITLEKNKKDERGLSLCKKAIHFYTERTKATGGFYQEVYYSQLSLARLSYHTNTNEFVMKHLLECEEMNIDGRVEHLFNIISYMQQSNLHQNALLYLKLALKYLKEGTDNTLFIEKFIYDWVLYDMYGVSLFYTGKLDEALKYFNYSFKKLQQNGNANDTDTKRVANNIKSAQDAIQRRDSTTKKGIRI